ncbi:MAG: hypothetical protein AB1512_04310 [Thermodesulfobacteriota bacterium]
MRDKAGVQQKVQEMIDCYAETDPLKGMSELSGDKDPDEAALKWLALAVLHGINANAREVSIMKSRDGGVKVISEYRNAELPSPGPGVGEKIIQSLRSMAHVERDKVDFPLSLGIRDGSIGLRLKMKRDKEGERATLKFPE